MAGVLLKLTLVVAAFYFFICSLSFLASGFRLVAGRQAGMIFRNSLIFNNPSAGVLVGVALRLHYGAGNNLASRSSITIPAYGFATLGARRRGGVERRAPARGAADERATVELGLGSARTTRAEAHA